MITVKHLKGENWLVTLKFDGTTQHQVRVGQVDLERFGGGASAKDLLKESFHFLLERESNTSILRSFDLSVIKSYFPEYEAEIRRRLGTD